MRGEYGNKKENVDKDDGGGLHGGESNGSKYDILNGNIVSILSPVDINDCDYVNFDFDSNSEDEMRLNLS
jgi:hypothetical protein